MTYFLADSASQYSNIVMMLRKAANHPLLLRNLYQDEALLEMAKKYCKVLVVVIKDYGYAFLASRADLNQCTRKRGPKLLKIARGAANLRSSHKISISRANETKFFSDVHSKTK